MTRVSENSATNALNYSVSRSKAKLEDLQLKGANLKRIQKPSDDPVGNIELLAMRSRNIDNDQYLRNASFAKTQLNYTETAIEELTNIVLKAKEIAIGQASNLYSDDIRKSVAREVTQLRNQSISIANRRLGSRFLFAGHKSLSKPFSTEGVYKGDNGAINLEVAKDFFIPINFSGEEVFYEKKNTAMIEKPLPGQNPLEIKKDPGPNTPAEPNTQEQQKLDSEIDTDTPAINRNLASVDTDPRINKARRSIFADLRTLENALDTNNHLVIQGLLERLDSHANKLIEKRTKIGSLVNSIENAEENIEKAKVFNDTYKSKIEDADVAELFSDISKQKAVMQATYQTGSKMLNQSLLDFLR